MPDYPIEEIESIETTNSAVTDRALLDRAETVINQPNREEQSDIYKDYHAVNVYKFLYDCYTGRGGFSGQTEETNGIEPISYITPNPTENFYKTRVKSTPYINYFAKYIKAPIKGVFAQSINTTVKTSTGSAIENHPYNNFIDNVNGSGAGYQEFLSRQVLPSALRDSVVFVVMDKMEDAILPYIYIKMAYEVADYTTDDLGNLTSITFNEESKKDGDNTVLYRRYWGYDVFALMKSTDKGENWVVIEEIENNLGILPVKAMRPYSYDTGDYLPYPDSYNIAALSTNIYDKWSDLSWVLKKQAYARLVINGQIDGVGTGTDNALVIPDADTNLFQPFLLTPPAEIIKVHVDIINALKDELFELMGENGVSVSESGQAESGISKAYSFSSTNVAQQGIVNICKELDVWLLDAYKVYQGEEGNDYEVFTEYPSDFQPKPSLSLDELMRLAEYYDMASMPKNLADVHKQILKITKPNANSDELETLYIEIENGGVSVRE